MEVNGYGNANDYSDDQDFMIPTIIHVIDHINNNFEIFATQKENNGDINQVYVELVAAILFGCSEGLRIIKKENQDQKNSKAKNS